MSARLLDLVTRLPGLDPESAASDPLDGVVHGFRLRARRRLAWLRHLAGQAGAGGTGDAELEAALGGWDTPAAEARWRATDPEARALDQAIAALAPESGPDPAPLSRLLAVFGIAGPERDLLESALAVALDPSLERACAHLHQNADRPYFSDLLAARLYDHDATGLWDAGMRLARWEIVASVPVSVLDPPLLRLDPVIRDWLVGAARPDPLLGRRAAGIERVPPLEGWPVAETAARVERVVSGGGDVRVEVAAPRGTGRRSFAAHVADALGLGAFAIEAPADAESAGRRVLRIQRHAFLESTAPVWHGRSVAEPMPALEVPPFPIQFFALLPSERLSDAAEAVTLRVELPETSLERRVGLWRERLPTVVTWRAGELQRLARRHPVGPGEIAAVAAAEPAGPEEAAALLRERRRSRMGGLVRRMETPFRRDDLVVPERVREVLDDLTHEADYRVRFWEAPARRRLFPQGRALLALFSGPPGTGKTMAAQVLAAELELDLFRIDLSAVISKYVGETAQNLQRLLADAPDDAVLLFDEADTLFGKRTEIRDAHDRFANADTNHLLQAVEEYRGVAVLATNRKDNVDAAFLRRLRYVVEFPRPDAEQRARLWRRLVEELAGERALEAVGEAAVGSLAATLELTGAQIKGAVLSALLRADRDEGEVSFGHLLHGVDRELMKEGRALSDRDRERLRRHER